MKVFDTRPEGPTENGGTKLRCDNAVIQGIRVLGARKWRMCLRRQAEVSEEDQGPHKTVEPMMMMMMISILYETRSMQSAEKTIYAHMLNFIAVGAHF